LTEIAADIPIVVINQSGHVAYANEQAFKEANITSENASPDFVRDPVTGELTGEIFETGVFAIAGKAPPPSPSDIVKATHSTLLEWAGKGVTTAFDARIGSTGQTDIPLLAAVTAETPPLRLRGALVSTIIPLNTIQFIQPPPLNIGRVEVNAIKFWTDGSTQGFTAAVKEPYLPTELGNRGILNYKTNEILRASLEP
jgi:predicted amidohydrolase YtcJ